MHDVSTLIELQACTLDLQFRKIERDGASLRLTHQESQLLAYLIERNGQVVSRETLLNEVWKYSSNAETRAVDLAIRRLRVKIERDASDPDHLQVVHGVGYRWVGTRRVAPPSFESPWITAGTMEGRDDALVALNAQLHRNPAVLIHGPAGVGKSRLAVEYSKRDPNSDQVFYVVLTNAANLAEFLQSLALATQVTGDPWTVVPPRIQDALLILDNADRCLEPVVEAIRRFQHTRAKFLVTSRESILEIPSFELLPLTVEDAVTVFLDRVTSAGGSVETIPRALAEKLVIALDGLPLAIELAAARTQVLTAEEILAALDQRFRLLQAPASTSRRHRNLTEALDLSWEGLSAGEQNILCALSTFREGFSYGLAAAITDENDGWLPDVLQSLLGKSLLQGERALTEERRFRLLESIREFVDTKLEPERRHILQIRHLKAFQAFASTRTEYEFCRQSGLLTLATLDLENLVAAFDFACKNHDTGSAHALLLSIHAIHRRRGPTESAAKLIQQILDLPALSAEHRREWRLRRSLLYAGAGLKSLAKNDAEGLGVSVSDASFAAGLARVNYALRDHAAAERFALAGIELAQRPDQLEHNAACYAVLASIHLARRDLTSAKAHLERSAQAWRDTGNVSHHCLTEVGRGGLAGWEGDVALATSKLEFAAARLSDLGDMQSRAFAYATLSETLLLFGDANGARNASESCFSGSFGTRTVTQNAQLYWCASHVLDGTGDRARDAMLLLTDAYENPATGAVTLTWLAWLWLDSNNLNLAKHLLDQAERTDVTPTEYAFRCLLRSWCCDSPTDWAAVHTSADAQPNLLIRGFTFGLGAWVSARQGNVEEFRLWQAKFAAVRTQVGFLDRAPGMHFLRKARKHLSAQGLL